MKKFVLIILIIITITAALAAYLWWGNNSITVTHHEITNEDLPESFEGFRILQVSDFHNTDFGDDITEKIAEEKPDIIVITGDLIDFYETNLQISLDFIEKIVKIAPVYYVTGNHEYRIAEYPDFRNKIEAFGVKILEGKTEKIVRNGEEISISGVDDFSYFGSAYLDENLMNLENELSEISAEKANTVSILLSHRPELFDSYVKADFDLVFCGHAHGGQIRLPFLGGILAPSQGFFPEYDGGIYSEDGTDMVVSRGLGNSVFPFRINNRPELISVVLKGE